MTGSRPEPSTSRPADTSVPTSTVQNGEEAKSHSIAAFVLWAAAVLCFIVSLIVGTTMDRLSRGSVDGPPYTLWPLICPIFASVIYAPLLIVSTALSAVSLKVAQRRRIAIATLVLVIPCLAFATWPVMMVALSPFVIKF